MNISLAAPRCLHVAGLTYTLPVSIATTEGERALVGQHALAALTKPATVTLDDGVKAQKVKSEPRLEGFPEDDPIKVAPCWRHSATAELVGDPRNATEEYIDQYQPLRVQCCYWTRSSSTRKLKCDTAAWC